MPALSPLGSDVNHAVQSKGVSTVLKSIATIVTVFTIGIAAVGPCAAQSPSHQQFTMVSKGHDYPTFLAFDSRGDLYVTNNGDGTISRITLSNGRVETFARGLGRPQGLAFDGNGILFVANLDAIWKVYPDGNAVIFATLPRESVCPRHFDVYRKRCGASGASLVGLAFDAMGRLSVATFGTKTVKRLSPQGAPSVIVSGLGQNRQSIEYGDFSTGPYGLAADRAGNLYVSLRDGFIRKILIDGSERTLGSTGIGSDIRGIAVDDEGNIFAASREYRGRGLIGKMTPDGQVELLATGLADDPQGVALDGRGNLFVANRRDGRISRRRIVPGRSLATSAPRRGQDLKTNAPVRAQQ